MTYNSAPFVLTLFPLSPHSPFSPPSAELQPIPSTLLRVFKEVAAALDGPAGNPARRRELEANSKKLGALFVRLNSGDVSASVAGKLLQLCAALDAGDFATALRMQVGGLSPRCRERSVTVSVFHRAAGSAASLSVCFTACMLP